MLSQEFIDYATNLGLKIDYDLRCSYAPITLFIDLGDGRQAYKHFESEEEAINHIKNGYFFGNQGLWGEHINKFPDRCGIDIEF